MTAAIQKIDTTTHPLNRFYIWIRDTSPGCRNGYPYRVRGDPTSARNMPGIPMPATRIEKLAEIQMSSRRLSLVRFRLRRPEYTGSNRCLPCTVVNLAITAGVTAVVATQSPPVAVGVAVVALASIYLRGYLVPGTPALTKRYLPDRLFGWFGKGPPTAAVTDEDPGSRLLGAGLLSETVDGSDLRLDPSFASDWEGRTQELLAGADEQAVLAALLEVPADALLVTSGDQGVSAHLAGEPLGSWESRTAFFADMAGVDLLGSLIAGWDDVSIAERGEIAGTLRLFAESCPRCGGRVELGEETVESCCSTREIVTGECVSCGARLFELRLTDPMREIK